jgi:hypothetical protein
MSPRTAIAVADEMGLDEGSLNQLFRDAPHPQRVAGPPGG